MTRSLKSENNTGLEELVGYNLKRAYMIFQSGFRETLGKDGLAPRAYSALALAVGSPDITQSEMARRLGIERSGLVAIVDQLESHGYLRRVSVPGDRRVQALTPTNEGKELYAFASRQVVDHEEMILSVLTESERSMLVDILTKLRSGRETGQ